MLSTSLQRRSSYPYCGRLVVLQGFAKPFDPFAGFSAFEAINFPAMPDSIELARSTEYLVVNSQIMPDGIHQYKWTNPLVIPFSFKLHSFDKDFCPRGARSLLEMAALLHAMQLPLTKEGASALNMVTTVAPDKTRAGDASALAARGQTADTATNITADSQADFYPPVTVRLELIFTDDTSPGICCTGYIKDVKAKLNGPWLRGPGQSCNLPTSCDYEFNFVHVPGYGNGFSIKTSAASVGSVAMPQAYGDDVKERLYNTRQMPVVMGRSYKGFAK